MNATLMDTRASAMDEIPKYTGQEWEELCARLEVKYRAKYQKEIADYRERFGEEPSLGTLVAAEARAECNNMTKEQRAKARAHGMAIYNAARANFHAGHTTRR